ncbi:MAG: SMP-30/gluconolactonase/LRE family protein, partial [Bacteroidota bacterium]
DDLDISSEGIIYFSDASAKFNNTTLKSGPPYLPLGLLEARPHGALYAYNTYTGETQLLLDSLYFANGVALTKDESAVLVVETPRYRIKRLWLTGPKAGTSDIFANNVPGLADGITSDRQGNQYLTIQTLRSSLLDEILHPRPMAKALLAKLPRSLWVHPKRYGFVIVYDEKTGTPITSLHDPQGEVVFGVANAVPYGNKLYLGTLSNDAIAVVPNPVKYQPR